MNAKGILVLSLALSAGLLLPAADGHHPASAHKARTIDVEQFDKLRQSKNHTVLDVRTEKEFKAGHIPGAMNLDVNAPDFAGKAAKLDKDRTYLVHCMVGHRSATASGKLLAAGFTNVLDFTSGLKAWEKAGKPIEK
jgi:rhodanese-related sulfurtransferase